MSKLSKILNPSDPVRRGIRYAGVFLVGFVVLGVISIQVWEATNTSAFCANVCHDVHPEEPAAYADSYHAEVKCVECHMGRVSTLRKVLLKASHSRHLPETLFQQYDRPTEAETLIPPNQSCERCHWPPAFHGDNLREIEHYQPDRENSRIRTYLTLRTGSGGSQVETIGEGIHWHIANQVEYIAAGEEDENIHWVRASFPDGTTTEYHDVTDPLSAEEIADAEIHSMDCVDCHNQVGHPFYAPDRLVDLALETGRLSQDLPYAKRFMVEILSRDYGSQEAAIETVSQFRERYEQEYPEIAAEYEAEIASAADLARELVTVVVFESEGVTWESFPDHSGHGGHKPFPGCFRCHNGKLLSADEEPIRVQCTLCHSIPAKAGPSESPPEIPAAAREQPESHQVVDFVAEHRWQANEECASCHGEIAFGADDSSFCSNSACHGQEWPELELDPTQEHPIPLEGEHADAWCHDCHNGDRMPEYECANCHEPPPDHYGNECQDCHTPAGFEDVTLGELTEDFEPENHPFPLDHGGVEKRCNVCHPGSDPTVYTCLVCHEPNSTKELHDRAEISDIFAKCADCHP